MKKLVFIIFSEFSNSASGIERKILSQFNELKKYFEEAQLLCPLYSDGVVNLYDYASKQIVAQCNNRLSFLKSYVYMYLLIKHLKESTSTFAYIRHAHNTNVLYLRLVNILHCLNNKIFIELPTYPYDGENKFSFTKKQIVYTEDKIFRRFLHIYVDRIVTFSADETIWGVKTVNISNAVNLDKIPLRIVDKGSTPLTYRLIAVASINFWHGYDRILCGLNEYYKNFKAGRDLEVRLEIVGGGNDECIAYLKSLVDKFELSDYVCFHGFLCGEPLDNLFNISNFAIGSLGRHRSGIKALNSLKNREYAARGIPFMYSEEDAFFDKKEYVIKVAPDESFIDVNRILSQKFIEPREIRASIEDSLTWTVQMDIVYKHI